MFGSALMVAPVYEYGARNREAYFPASCGWYDFYLSLIHISVHGVDGVDHSFRVGVTFGIELMASPGILLPVQPVDYDI